MSDSEKQFSILVDGREFVSGRMTGIGRFLEGLLNAVVSCHPEWRVAVALDHQCELPSSLQHAVEVEPLSRLVELAWPKLAKGRDLFISPYPKLPWLKLPCPAIHTVHDVLYLTHPAYRSGGLKRLYSAWQLRSAISRASLSWFVSECSRQECEALVGKGRLGKVRHSPVDDCFTPLKGSWQQKDPFMLYVGNGLPHKNLEVLLKALQGSTLRLCCIGVRTSVAASLQQQYPAVSGQVEFYTHVDDSQLVDFYRRATALLLPSTAEGYGFPPLEAMACGTPAIVSDIPVLRETTGGHALFCSPHEVRAWREAMLSIRSAGLRNRMVSDARHWIDARRAPAGWGQHVSDVESFLYNQ